MNEYKKNNKVIYKINNSIKTGIITLILFEVNYTGVVEVKNKEDLDIILIKDIICHCNKLGALLYE